MLRRLLAIGFIYLCTSVAWLILGATTKMRTELSSDRLRGRVQSLWGAPQLQVAPTAEYEVPVRHPQVITENGRSKTLEEIRTEKRTVRPAASEIAVDLQSEPRKKGLLWYATYKVGFRGEYQFRNPDPEKRTMRLCLRLPAAQAIYDDLQFLVNGQPVAVATDKTTAYVSADVPPSEDVKLQVSYRSQGLESWKYSFGSDVSPVQNFNLRLTTNFQDVDFLDNTLAPTEKRAGNNGWQLDWKYKNLLSGYEIAITMPEKLQPGPLASEISFFAPISLFFFYFVIFIIVTLRDIDLHPMNYFFISAAFFAFHLLLAYLADHVDVHIAFLISSIVSVFLVVSYLRLVAGMRFAIREAALAQMIYLVLFSYAFFFKGLTGLSITIGAVLTLFVVMQMTGRIRWTEKFARFDSRNATPAQPQHSA